MKGTAVFPGAPFPRSDIPGDPGRLAVAAAAFACVATVAGCASSGSQSAAPTTTATVTTTAPAAPGSASSSTPTSSPSPAVTGALGLPDQLAAGEAGSRPGLRGRRLPGHRLHQHLGQHVHAVRLSRRLPGLRPAVHPDRPGRQTERPSAPVKLVTLAPGATANALLQIVDALNYPSASCGPTKATALKIYPPNQTVPVYLPSTSNGCAKPVQIMYIGPVQPGSGSSS